MDTNQISEKSTHRNLPVEHLNLRGHSVMDLKVTILFQKPAQQGNYRTSFHLQV